jgi:hypothetical protein
MTTFTHTFNNINDILKIRYKIDIPPEDTLLWRYSKGVKYRCFDMTEFKVYIGDILLHKLEISEYMRLNYDDIFLSIKDNDIPLYPYINNCFDYLNNTNLTYTIKANISFKENIKLSDIIVLNPEYNDIPTRRGLEDILVTPVVQEYFIK